MHAVHNEAAAAAPAAPTVRFHYRRLDVAELALVNDLYNSYYPEQRPLDEAKWFYERNPNGPAVIYAAFDDDGRLAGMRPSIPYRVWWRGQERTAFEFADALVDPRHQGRGIFSRLVRTTCEWAVQAGHPVFSLPNANSLAVYQRNASLKIMGDSVTVAKPLAWVAYARYLLNRSRDGTTPLLPPPPSVDEGTLSLRAVDGFDSDFEPVHEELKRKGLSFTLRTRQFLQWRYFGSPVRRYHAALLVESGAVRGYLVLRTLGAIAHIVDFFAPLDERLARSGFRLAAKWAQSMGAIGIHFSCAGHGFYTAAAAKAGYRLKKRPRRLVVNRAATLLPGGATDGALALEDLYLVMGDFDFF
jgi:GNAT superfamily N-acetyltransferase